MTKPIQLLTCIPFAGFYGSIWSEELDQQESSFAEHHARESDGDESKFPESLRLTESEICDVLFYVTDYSSAHLDVAKMYCDVFAYKGAEVLAESAGWTHSFGGKWPRLPLTFESMSSPREYNFETDRIFAHIPLSFVKLLFARSRAENHATLAKVIRERFTSRSGFISHYDNDLPSWTRKPIGEWDHNEVGTLLIAALRLAGVDPDEDDEFRMDLYYAVTEHSGGIYEAWSDAVDWAKYDERCLDARVEKIEALAESDPESLAQLAQELAGLDPAIAGPLALAIAENSPALAVDLEAFPIRCPLTVDMFEGRPS